MSHLTHVAQIAGTVRLRRRAHADEGAVRAGDAFFKAGGEGQPAVSATAPHHGFQAGLKDMHGTGVEFFHHSGVHIHANHRIAHFREAGRADQSHIACTDDAQFHGMLFSLRSSTLNRLDAPA